MADLLGNILVAYAAAAWAQGFRAEDRTMIGMMISVREEDLDIICALLTKWEKEESGEE